MGLSPAPPRFSHFFLLNYFSPLSRSLEQATRRLGIRVNLKSRLPQFLGILNSPQPGLPEFLIGWEAIKRQSNNNCYLYYISQRKFSAYMWKWIKFSKSSKDIFWGNFLISKLKTRFIWKETSLFRTGNWLYNKSASDNNAFCHAVQTALIHTSST